MFDQIPARHAIVNSRGGANNTSLLTDSIGQKVATIPKEVKILLKDLDREGV